MWQHEEKNIKTDFDKSVKKACRKNRKGSNYAGSLTVEAAFVVPLTFYAIFMFFYLFSFYALQLEVQDNLTELATRLQRTGGAYEQLRNRAVSDDTLKLVSELGIDSLVGSISDTVYVSERMGELMEESMYLSFVQYGKEGFLGEGSSILLKEGEIKLKVKYRIVFPISMFGLVSQQVEQCVEAKAFCGVETLDEAIVTEDTSEIDDDTTVYVTKTGEVYHLDGKCSSLKVSVRKVLLSEIDQERSEDGAIYYPCKECGDSVGSYVYITSYGTNYHGKLSCSQIKRTVETITKAEAEKRGLRACKKCGGS